MSVKYAIDPCGSNIGNDVSMIGLSCLLGFKSSIWTCVKYASGIWGSPNAFTKIMLDVVGVLTRSAKLS